MAIKLWKKIPHRIRTIFLLLLFWVATVSGAYFTGTNQPNKWVVAELTKEVQNKVQSEWENYGFYEPEMDYNDNLSFVKAVTRCIDYINLTTPVEQRVPREIIVAMAVIETGYGTSRFALKGNNLFGVRTWNKDDAQLKPKDNPDVVWGVKTYITKCQSVMDMVSIINRLPVYEDFRVIRTHQLTSGDKDIFALVPALSEWSTNPAYTNLIISKIKKIQTILAKQVSKTS
ncbi:MAG: hypothetical protein CL815_00075 [Coraliomargarita sp.]|nr:hypothetical protein [Coraliomargarita sp.]|tara:strand:- start:5597 stop:6286 length:690 start_codon:yes stop_codon:yes gene_type:complete